jgi:membrane associated rhomboid family serine protease
MTAYRNRHWSVERPHAATFLLMSANFLVFGLCLHASNAGAISPDVLFADGAMYSQAIERHQYWRLIAHAFLHADPLHLAANMFCLALWGGPLERRIGPFYFLVIYLCAMVAGAILSDLHHSQSYLAVGASGAISGILGALLCLWILGKIDLSAQFFLVNIGLNAAIAMSSQKIDWVDHVGGFVAGLVVCALIDLLERASRFAFRCKFPEFVKINGAILGAMLGVLVWSNKPGPLASGSSVDWFLLLVYSASCLVTIKLVDLTLSLKRGLAFVVVALSVANAGLILLAVQTAALLPGPGCASPPPGAQQLVETLVDLACSNRQITNGIIAACAFAATLLLYSQELARGIKDVGFVGGSLRAERKRRQGI